MERGSVFESTRLTPVLEISDLERVSPYKVKRMIGIFGRTFRSSDAACKPFMRGMERSRGITSGLIRCASSIASLPSFASAQVLKPSDKKAVASFVRIAELSSTTSTVLPHHRFLGSDAISTKAQFRGFSCAPGAGGREP